jgi:AcrR family transcriptional regulator
VKNAIPNPGDVPPPTDGASGDAVGDLAGRIAQRSLAAREASYADEVQRLLDAALAVMHECGTDRSPRVIDIVAAAGLSNDAFYRHFAGKAELVAAIVEAGSARLAGYLAHQMAKADSAEGEVRAWIGGVMAQAANPAVAEQTRAVLWNGSSLGDRTRTDDQPPAHRRLLVDPIERMGSADPVRDAAVVFHAAFNRMEEFLWERRVPTRDDIEHLVAFCLAGISGR